MMQRVIEALKHHPLERCQLLGASWEALEDYSWESFTDSLLQLDEETRAEVARVLLEAVQGDHPVDLVPHPRYGLRINPITEAALAERLQFDEDIPELRTAPPDADTIPAVPVHNPEGVLSQVVLGDMLERARTDVKNRIKALRDSLPADTTDLVTTVVAPPDYPICAAPPHAVVPVPPATAILHLTRAQMQQRLWSTTSSARGIQTLTPILYDRIREHLLRQGVDCLDGPIPDGAPLIWQCDTSPPAGGAADLNPGFAFLESTCKAASTRLLRHCREAGVTSGTLTVTPHRDIAARRSGWVVAFHAQPVGALPCPGLSTT